MVGNAQRRGAPGQAALDRHPVDGPTGECQRRLGRAQDLSRQQASGLRRRGAGRRWHRRTNRRAARCEADTASTRAIRASTRVGRSRLIRRSSITLLSRPHSQVVEDDAKLRCAGPRVHGDIAARVPGVRRHAMLTRQKTSMREPFASTPMICTPADEALQPGGRRDIMIGSGAHRRSARTPPRGHRRRSA